MSESVKVKTIITLEHSFEGYDEVTSRRISRQIKRWVRDLCLKDLSYIPIYPDPNSCEIEDYTSKGKIRVE